MTIANVKGMVAKFMVAGLVTAAFTLAGTAKADAQQFAVGVEFGHPAYVANDGGSRQDHYDYHHDRDGYQYSNDGYRFDRDDYRRQQEFRERQERAEFLRRQEFIRHQQWERYHRYDRPYDYR